jgi:hypothetical protein
MNTFRLLLAGCSLLLVAGCSKQASAAGGSGAPAPAAIGPELMAKLAKADAADGKTDKIVHKCAGCSLGMDGTDAHSLKVQDYTMHFCSDKCLAPYKADAAKEIAALKIKE